MRLLLISLVLVGCQTVTPRVETVTLPVRQYVPVPSALTKRCTWIKDGPISEVVAVARGRRACLEIYEGQLEQIERIGAGVQP